MAKPKIYYGEKTDKIAYPLGGFGAGMFCFDGKGAYRAFSVRNEAALGNNPNVFAAVTVGDGGKSKTRVLEGQVGYSRIYGNVVPGFDMSPGAGMSMTNFGLPRFQKNSFYAKFPFANVRLTDSGMPLSVAIEAFSPFIPSDADSSSLPCASVKYTFKNTTDHNVDATFYFAAMQFMNIDREKKETYTERINNGFMFDQKALEDKPWAKGEFAVTLDKKAMVDTDFFRGGWWDPFTVLVKNIGNKLEYDRGAEDKRSPGGALSHSFVLEAGKTYSVTVRFAWYVPDTTMRYGTDADDPDDLAAGKPAHRPWYADKFASAEKVMRFYVKRHAYLLRETRKFTNALYATDLDDIVIDAIASNLVILKSPTVVRQTDGRMWGWEGSLDTYGSCPGTTTHVWNYAQAVCNLFPALERTLRETEFFVGQNEEGHQAFRVPLPIRKTTHNFHAASDGQLGGIMKLYREWRISGDDEWMCKMYPKMVESLDYCIRTWDPDGNGVLREPHHNTYDIEFWGADAMCSSFYLGALKAASEIGKSFGKDVSRYEDLYRKGRNYLETALWNGEYFYQIPEWKTLRANFDPSREYPVSRAILEVEGPKYQYGSGCISDGVLGAWMAKLCGLGDILDPEKVKSHLRSVYKYNFRRDLREHTNGQRPGYALGNEGGLLLCSWPYGNKPSLPFVYSDEVWTGIEYQVASHLAMNGYPDEALDIVKTLRDRYDGIKRNPFDEYECGHWYARALASYSLLEAFSGVTYDKRTKILKTGKKDCKVFLATDGGYGLVTVKDGKAKLDVIGGSIEVAKIVSE